MTPVCAEWVYADDDKQRAIKMLREPPFKDASFLVERGSGTIGCTCNTKTETMLAVYQGKAVAMMLSNPSRWSVIRYTVINSINGR